MVRRARRCSRVGVSWRRGVVCIGWLMRCRGRGGRRRLVGGGVVCCVAVSLHFGWCRDRERKLCGGGVSFEGFLFDEGVDLIKIAKVSGRRLWR